MNPKEVADKLEEYENKAYEGGYGIDWLSDIGSELKLYMIDCDKNKARPTMEGLLQRIDKMHKSAES
jgi:hypothetical protein